jgi:hypothetical protein
MKFHTNSNNLFSGFYRGKVLYNVDPDKLGRIKIEIFGVFDDIEYQYIPWAVPAFSLGFGSGLGFGNFSVPEVGSFVWCFFEKGDFNQPVYFAEAPSAVYGIPPEAETNYPNRKVFKTSGGIIIYVDNSNNEIKVEHPTGSYIIIDTSGNINISGTTIHLNP